MASAGGCETTTGQDVNAAWDDRRAQGPDDRPFWLLLERSWAVAARLWLVCLVFLALSGCGIPKEELESAKQQITKLNGDIMKLNEAVANLDKEKTRLSEEFKMLSEKDAKRQQELENLKKDKAALSGQRDELKKRNAVIEEEVTALKRDKADLLQQVDDLKKRVAGLAGPAKEPGSGAGETSQEPSAKEPLSRARETLTPCDALIEFMKASRAIVEGHKGEVRAKLLQQLRKDYSSRLREAPHKAVKAAEAWVEELSLSWDKTHNDTVSNLLKKRNAALDACGKKPQEAGF